MLLLSNIRWMVCAPIAVRFFHCCYFYLCPGLQSLAAFSICLSSLSDLSPLPVRGDGPLTESISRPLLFNTPEADRVLEKLVIFPPDNVWKADISHWPVAADSSQMIARIGANERLAYNLDMAFVLVPPQQPRVPVQILEYADESDPGPYPIPDNAPIENWPLDGRTLSVAQQAREEGDRHVIVVDPFHRRLYELYQGRRTPNGWECSSAAVFDLTSNQLRPQGWTSADAAGLPIFPAVVRYDEVQRGVVNHALRFTVKQTRRAFVAPATHFASRQTDPLLPRMGERFRLKRDFDTRSFSPHVQAILKGLQTHGMFVADNGGNWRISIAPDARISGLDELRRVRGSDFEVVTDPRHQSEEK